jgi:hypothetical protein
MIKVLRQKINELETLKKSINIIDIFKKKEVIDYIIELNRYDQIWKDGVDYKNEIIGYYSYASEKIANIEGRSFTYRGETKVKEAGDPFFLLDSKSFFDSFDVIVGSKSFKIVADSDTADEIERNYGNVLGLTDESKKKFKQFIYDKYFKKNISKI